MDTLYWFILIYLLNVFFIFLILLFELKIPTATLAWVLLLILLPGVGFIIYMLFAQSFSRNKMYKMKVVEKKKYGDYLNKQISEFKDGKLLEGDANSFPHKYLIGFNLCNNGSYYSENNDITIFIDGNEKFKELFRCMNNAKSHIHVFYYIIKNDSLGQKLLNALTEKAKEGIEVRLLYDSLGSRELKKRDIQPLLDAGGKVGKFFPGLLKFPNIKAHYRNHRKIVVVDGKIGFVGGLNVGEEYLGLDETMGYWRDTHVKIIGSAVIDLQTRFILDWNVAKKESLGYSEQYYPDINSLGNSGMQIVSSGPDAPFERIKYNFLKMINYARESIHIQTPYFVPDSSVIEALKVAAMSGIDVKIMIPNKPDHMFVYWATYYYVGQLLNYGVKVYTYEKGFLHSKTIIIDNEISTVGSANFDVRSFTLNFEITAVFYDKAIVEKFTEIYHKDLESCLELTKELYLQRSLTVKFKESISRIMAPLL